MHKIPITQLMLEHLTELHSLDLPTTLHAFLEKVGLLAVEATPVRDIPNGSRYPDLMRLMRKSSCVSREMSAVSRVGLQIEASGVYGVVNDVLQPLELFIFYSTQIHGKGKMTIAMREQYTLQGEVESRVTHVTPSTNSSKGIFATRKVIDGRVMYEMLRVEQQLQLPETLPALSATPIFYVQEAMHFSEYKQWVSNSFAEVHPNDLTPVEILIARDYLSSGNKEHSYFTGTCSPDDKHWKGKMSIVVEKNHELSIVELCGKILRKDHRIELLHDDRARFTDYQLINPFNGLTVETNPRLRFDENYIARGQVEWTDSNQSITALGSATTQQPARHQVSLCFEKKETVGPIHEGLQNGLMKVTDRWGKWTFKYDNKVGDDSFVGTLTLPYGQGEGACSVVQMSEQERVEFAFYREANTDHCGFLVRGCATKHYTAEQWIPMVFDTAPALLIAFISQAPIQVLLDVTPALLMAHVNNRETVIPWPDVWFGHSTSQLPEKYLPSWSVPFAPIIQDLLYEDVLSLLESLDKHFTQKKVEHLLAKGVKSLTTGSRWLMKNKSNLNRAVANLNAKQRHELGDVFQQVLTTAVRMVNREQSADELFKSIFTLLLQDYIPGIVARCCLIESLYQEILGVTYPELSISMTRNWLMKRQAIYAQKQAEEEVKRSARCIEKRKVYESENVEAILSANIDIPLEREHLAACETAFLQEWRAAQNRLLSAEEMNREILKKADRIWWKGIKSTSLCMLDIIKSYEQLQPLQQFQNLFEQGSVCIHNRTKKAFIARDTLYKVEDVSRQKLTIEEQMAYATMLVDARIAARRAIYQSDNVEQILTETVDVPLLQEHLAACEALFLKEKGVVALNQCENGEVLHRQQQQEEHGSVLRGLGWLSACMRKVVVEYEQFKPKAQAFFESSSLGLRTNKEERVEHANREALISEEKRSYQAILALLQQTPAVVAPQSVQPPVTHQAPIWRSNNPYGSPVYHSIRAPSPI